MKILTRIVYPILLVALLTQCKKDHGVLGVDVQPASDALNAGSNGSLDVYAHTVKFDSTANLTDRYRYLGSNQDPYFGRMDVGMYLNSNMDRVFVDFGADASIKSSEIILAVDNLYYAGEASAQLTFSVFVLDSALSASRIYYTNNTSLHNKKTLVSVATVGFSVLNGKTVLRIPIDLSYAGAILTNPNYLINNDAFQSAYKGFYITAAGTSLGASSQGIIYKCDTEDDISGFYLNFQNGTPSATKKDKSFQFRFSGSKSAKFNTVKFQPAQGGTANLVQQVINNDTTQGKEDLYLKGMGATKVRVHIPALKNYADSSNISVSRAEVVFNVDPSLVSATGQYVPPPKLSLLPLDSIGRERYAKDQVSAARYDGTYDAANKRYVFNIARYVQALAKGKVKYYGFYLVIANADLLPSIVYYGPSKDILFLRRDNYIERVILAGSNKGDLKPKFNLTYVKLKNQ